MQCDRKLIMHPAKKSHEKWSIDMLYNRRNEVTYFVIPLLLFALPHFLRFFFFFSFEIWLYTSGTTPLGKRNVTRELIMNRAKKKKKIP